MTSGADPETAAYCMTTLWPDAEFRWSRLSFEEDFPQGPKPSIIFLTAFVARLKPCPFKNRHIRTQAFGGPAISAEWLPCRSEEIT